MISICRKYSMKVFFAMRYVFDAGEYKFFFMSVFYYIHLYEISTPEFAVMRRNSINPLIPDINQSKRL
jgi:hypothetical protein